MTFKTLITKYACASGRKFCKAHGFDLTKILSAKVARSYNEDNYPDASESVVRGIRICVRALLHATWETSKKRQALMESDSFGVFFSPVYQWTVYREHMMAADSALVAYYSGEYDRADAAKIRKMLTAVGVTF